MEFYFTVTTILSVEYFRFIGYTWSINDYPGKCELGIYGTGIGE